MKILILILFLITNCAKNYNVLKNMDKNINEKLILALEEGKYLEALFLIQDGADVNYVNKDNKSVLEIAINKRDVGIIKLLLEKEISINKEETITKIYELALDNFSFGILDEMLKKSHMLKKGSIDDNKYLLFLCYASNLEEVEKFIEDKKLGPNLNKSALNFSICGGNLKITEFLIKNYKLDLNFNDENALLEACRKGHIETIKLLLEHKFNMNIDKLLHTASQEGNKELIKLLLSKGANINSKIERIVFGLEFESTPLMKASEKGQVEIVKFLIGLGADVNERNSRDRTALTIATEKGFKDVVELLIEAGANVRDNKNNTATINFINKNLESNLILAVLDNDIDQVVNLTQAGANIDYKNEDGRTALMLASEDGRIEIVKLLIEKGANINDKDDNGATALMLASSEGHTGIVKLLIEKDANINDKDDNGATALIIASRNGHNEIAKLLIEKGADVNYKGIEGVTALISASINRYIEIVNLLIERGADINLKSKGDVSVLMLASINDYIEIVELLIEKGANINDKDENGATSLMLASSEGHTGIVKLLIEKGANVNDKHNTGRTALMEASEKGNKEIVKLLIEKGANINDKDNAGWSALMIASRHGQLKVVKLLLDAEANINTGSNKGITALSIASLNNNLEVVDLLIKNLCDINIKDIYGLTSLMFAAHEGHNEIVKLLLRSGAEINIKDKNENSALTCALVKNNREVVKTLLENFCEVDDKINLNNILEELIIEKIKNKDIENASLLIVNYNDKIKFNFKDNQDNSFLHYAAMVGDYKLFNLLLKDKFHINSINKNRETPLYYALKQEKIDETFICYLINKGAILGQKFFINDKPIVDVISPFERICSKLVYEPLIEKFLSTSFTFTALISFKMEKDKFKELVKAIKLNQEDFINETSMIDFLRDILLESPIKKINLNEVDIKEIADLDTNLFDEIFNSFMPEDYCDNILAKGIEESKKVFKEILTKIVKAKPAIVDSHLSGENEKNFKVFIAKKRLSKLIMLIRVLRGTAKNDQRIKSILNDLLDNLVFKNGSLETIDNALKGLSGKDVDIKEIIDENLMNLRYEILKEVVNEEINKNNINVEIDGELYETALTPYLLSNLTLSIGNIIKVKPIYDEYSLKYKYDKNYISKEVLKRYELKMVSYLQNKILEDNTLNNKIRDYIEKEIFKGRAILEVEDFVYDIEGKIKEDILKALLARFKFLISGHNFNFGSNGSSDNTFDPSRGFNFGSSDSSNNTFGPSKGFSFNF